MVYLQKLNKMKISLKQKKVIVKKNAKLEAVKLTLKTEFIGLDLVIDNIIDNIRPFYIFPKSLKRPLIINLFGMTATGKTDLVERLVKLIDLENKYVRFDIGEYANDGDWKLKNDFTEKVCQKNDNNMVIVFDEIQFGRTIDEKGSEINKQSLRSMWEVIDSGILTVPKRLESNFFRYFKQLEDIDFKMFFDKDLRTKSFETSIIVSDLLYAAIFSQSYKTSDINIIHENCVYSSTINAIKLEHPDCISIDGYIDVKKLDTRNFTNFNINSHNKITGLTIVPERLFTKMSINNPNFFSKYTHSSYLEFLTKFETKDDLFKHFYSVLIDGKSLLKFDLSKSLIFVIGNIDEAYKMSHSSNPDADADIFHEYSLKITPAKMKEALTTRFRMEQIGRLGNNIIIYPSFSCDSYKKIINKLLKQRIDYFKSEFKISLSFTESLEDIVYKESVFPSQGVRPLLSSISTFIDSYITNIISDIILKRVDTDNIIWSFNYINNAHNIIVKTKTEDITLEYPVTLKIENLRKSDLSENQSYTAIHESGHALVSIVKAKLIPKLVASKTASTAEGFCRIELPDIKTKETEYLNILIALGGRAAEKYILKSDEMLSTGSYSDLSSVTEIANKMIKAYGHGDSAFVIRHSDSEILSFRSENLLLDAEKVSKKLIETAEKEVDNVMLEYKDLLIEMIDYLSANSQLTDNQIKDILKKYNIDTKNKDNYYNIKEKIVEFKKENF